VRLDAVDHLPAPGPESSSLLGCERVEEVVAVVAWSGALRGVREATSEARAIVG
jgi:hypothetical protein